MNPNLLLESHLRAQERKKAGWSNHDAALRRVTVLAIIFPVCVALAVWKLIDLIRLCL